MSRPITLPYMAYEGPFRERARFPGLATSLTGDDEEIALRLFRRGLDTVDIAKRFDCTPAAAANAIARVRDRLSRDRDRSGER